MNKNKLKFILLAIIIISPIFLFKIFTPDNIKINEVLSSNNKGNKNTPQDVNKDIPNLNPGPSPGEYEVLPEVKINDITVKTEIAYTNDARHMGLMYRKQMYENHGMLFVFKEDRLLSFWMKNTVMPLSIAYIKENGRIVNILKMKPNDIDSSYVSKDRVRFALEMPQGWFVKNDIKEGDLVDLKEVKNWLKDKVIEKKQEDNE